MDRFPSIELSQLIEPGRNISYGIVQPGTPTDDGVPIIRVSDVRNSQIAATNPLRVRQDIEAQHSRTRLRGGELLITIVGTVGETAIVPQSLAGWNVARAIAVLPIRDDVGAYWVKLALQSPSVRARIDSRLNTTVQATLNLGDVAKLPILLPPKPERERIEAIIGAIDSKIDLNRRIIETLEAMARAIFKDWFVDFGPTRAKVQGDAPYLAQEIWKLFPDQLDDEQKPKGWDFTTLDQFMTFTGGSQPAADEFRSDPTEGYCRLLQIRDFDNDRHITYVPDSTRLRKVTEDDICIGRYGSGSGQEKDSLGRLCRGLSGAINVALIRVEPKFECREWLATYIASGSFRRDISGGSARAVQAGFRKEDLHHIRAVRASDQIHTLFEEIGSLNWEQAKSLRKQSRTLALTRDLLLPKLMSGDIRIKEAENISEPVA